MTDIARLAIEVDPKQLQAAVQQLQKLSVESAKAEVAAKKLEKAEASAALAMATANRQAATQAAQAATANNALSASQKQAAAETRRQADAAYQAARGADLQAAASLRAAQAAMQQSQAAQKIIMSNKDAAQSYEDLLQQQDRTTRNMGRLAGQQQANMANIAAQFQDIGVTAAMGMNPMMIGLQQGAQLTGVWGSVTGTTAQKLATFGAAIRSVLSPMSLLIMAITAGIAYLIQWGMEAFNASSDTKALEDATSSLSSMQSALGDMFDMTSGKIKNNSEMIRVNTLMTILNAQAKAQALAIESQATLGKAAEGKAPNFGLFASGFGILMSGPEQVQQKKNLRALQQFTKDYTEGRLKAVDAIMAAGKLDLRGTGFSADDLRKAIQGDINAKGIQEIADKAMGSVQNDLLNPSLRQPGRTRTPRAKKPEPTQGEKFDVLMAQSMMDLTVLKQEAQMIGLVGAAADQAAARFDLMNKAKEKGIDLSIDGRQQRIDDMSFIVAQQKESNRSAEWWQDLIESVDMQAYALERERGELSLTGAALVAYRFETEKLTAAKRDKIPLDEAEQKAIKDSAKIYGDATFKLQQQREEIDKYKSSLDAAKGATRDFLGSMKDGLLRGQSFWETWTSAVLSMIDRVIDRLLNDLVDAIFRANQSSGGGGLLGFIKGVFGAGINPAEVARLAPSASATIAANPGLFAKGGVFTNSVVHKPTHFFAKGGTPGVMGEAGPEAIMPLQRGPDGSLGVQMYGGGTNVEPTVVQVIPSEYFDVVVDQRAAKVAAPMVVQGAMVANKVSENTNARQARRRLR